MSNIVVNVPAVEAIGVGRFIVPRRLRVLWRLVKLWRRRRRLDAALEFADARVRDDVGVVTRRGGWVEGFLAPLARR